jgi:hypothetical protein
MVKRQIAEQTKGKEEVKQEAEVTQNVDPYYISVTEVEQYVDGSAMFQVEIGPKMSDLLIKEGFLSLVRKRLDDILGETPK